LGQGLPWQSAGPDENADSVDEVALETAALEVECRRLMCQEGVAEFMTEARLSKTEVLHSLESSTRLVRKRLAI